MTDDYWKNTEPCTSIEQLQEEQAALVEDIVHKADLLRIAIQALEDIKVSCVSSGEAHKQIVTRVLLRQHKIVSDALKKIEKKNRAILEK